MRWYRAPPKVSRCEVQHLGCFWGRPETIYPPGRQAAMATISPWNRRIVTMPSCTFFKAHGIGVLPCTSHVLRLKSPLSQSILTPLYIVAASKSGSQPRHHSGSGLTSFYPSSSSPAKVSPFPGTIVRSVWSAYSGMSGLASSPCVLTPSCLTGV